MDAIQRANSGHPGTRRAVVGMHTFGASAPLEQLPVRFSFTPDRVVEVARDRVAAAGGTVG